MSITCGYSVVVHICGILYMTTCVSIARCVCGCTMDQPVLNFDIHKGAHLSLLLPKFCNSQLDPEAVHQFYFIVIWLTWPSAFHLLH